MKCFRFFLPLAVALLLIQSHLWAHGANCPCCKHPTSVNPPHGGSLEWTPNLAIELVQQGSKVQIYVMTPDLKPIPSADLAVSGQISYPRNKPPAQSVELAAEDFYYTMKSEIPKGIYRYTLSLEVTYQGKKNSVQFVVEHLQEASGALELIHPHSYKR